MLHVDNVYKRSILVPTWPFDYVDPGKIDPLVDQSIVRGMLDIKAPGLLRPQNDENIGQSAGGSCCLL